MNGKALYKLYRSNPPEKRQSAHAVAYWEGYEGRPNRNVLTSYAHYAWKAGRDNRKQQTVRCDSCEMLSINGVPCHETGCPNSRARWDAASASWIKQRKCFECGCTIDSDDLCCNAPMEDEDEDFTWS